MAKRTLIGFVALAALSGCGLEGLFQGAGHESLDRPASKVTGGMDWGTSFVNGAEPRVPPGTTVSALGPGGEELLAFQTRSTAATYEARFPSSTYAFVRVQGRAGQLVLRNIVPSVGEETTVREDLDAASTTEALIVEAWLSANDKSFTQLTPGAYVGNGIDTGTRTLIRQAFTQPGPTRELYEMVQRLVDQVDLGSGQIDPDLFRVPVLRGPATPGGDPDYTVVETPLGGGFLARSNIDYTGDGIRDGDNGPFDQKLSEVAQLWSPAGCPDPDNVRLVFSVDFRAGGRDGNGGTVNRFKWATDKPGKQMYFVGWIHVDSPIQDPAVNARIGNSVPNQLPMFDDGTNGDEVANDGVWTIFFDVPRGVRVGYKYTWGTRGQGWTGSEEWPGNSRIIQVDDLNGDDFVFRYDVFGDEATNKDASNLNVRGTGTVSWDTDVRGCGRPEAREQPAREQIQQQNMRLCGSVPEGWVTPSTIGPLTLACSG
jgi:hypothetical protein